MARLGSAWPGLVAVAAFGAALRLVDAGARLSHDEGYSWLVAGAPDGAFLERLASTENTPPLFYLLLRLLPVSSEAWLRWPALVAGTLWVPVAFAIVAQVASRQAALVTALAVAVAPFLVSYSGYSRGFMVAGLGQLVAVLAAVRLVRRAGSPRLWGSVFVLASTLALYTEYSALAFHALLALALFVLARERWRLWAALAALPIALFAPWLDELQRSLDLLGETKLAAVSQAPSLGHLRDAVVPMVFGESGSAGAAAVRYLQLVVVVGVVAWALSRLHDRSERWLFGALPAGVLAAHALVSAVGGDVLRQRYLTVLVPLLAAAVVPAVLRAVPKAFPAMVVTLCVAGGAVAVHRAGREYEPDHARAVVLARARGATTVFTNSAVIAFYGRATTTVLDRPFGLGPGAEATCAGVCAVVDDARYGGVRPGAGAQATVGPIVVRVIEGR